MLTTVNGSSGADTSESRRTTTLRLPLDRSHPHTTVRTAYRFGGEASRLPDPFAENAVARSATVVALCSAIVTVPFLISDALGMAVMLSVGVFAVAGLVFVTPILVWSLAEAALIALQRRIHPTVEQLDLSPRIAHILRRHGITTIRGVERAADATLLSLSNMEPSDVRVIRRAVRLRNYRRWQEEGFPAEGIGDRG